jgi:hypothetical protein
MDLLVSPAVHLSRIRSGGAQRGTLRETIQTGIISLGAVQQMKLFRYFGDEPL